jgi:hypothetical protein
MIAEFMAWYSKLDKETIELLRRFMAKAFSTKDANAFIKRVMRAELDTIETTGKENT